MPARHDIDDELKLITTVWSGEATDDQLVDAFLAYQRTIRSQSAYRAYDEIVDFSNSGAVNLSTDGIKKIAQLAADTDDHGERTRLVIVAKTPITFGLGRMYEIYRGLIPSTKKEIRVVKDHAEALEWIRSRVD